MSRNPVHVLPQDVTYTYARAHLAKLWDEAIAEREPVIIHRRGKESVALIPVDELDSIQETAHLLRSPANAQRLFTALTRSHREQLPAQDPGDLAKSLGL
ncbi:MAG: type II toxin-antitoxin system Phd/YefM family antitoxin [Rhodothermales bacterium]|nr:type II toxin-antitoxin system Phd/YefM family antitoxin [Rhodothermales bacterium]MBO6780061.1 type II toxin-antitoxin system Phd/YefM family antitoxin [Rhodothermales bacterium]